MAALEARGLRREYQLGEHRVEALAGVDFRVEPGEFVAIMGPSGSGKSTLLHLLGGLDRPTAGEVILAGSVLSALDDEQATLARRRSIGFVFQFFNLLPTLTAAENVALPMIIDGRDEASYRARLDALLDLVGLAARRAHKPEQLSGGEQQRVALARALITEPVIVLADEPTGNLDTRTGATIMALLRRTCDELGRAVVVVTHDPRAAAYADRAVFLRDGRVVRELRFAASDSRQGRVRAIMDVLELFEE